MTVDNGPNWSVTGKQRSRARQLRQSMTDAERAIWYQLRQHRFFGRSFRRQAPIGPFVVDFVCVAEKLVVEIDGGQHLEQAGLDYDERRSAFLKAKGFRVLRFDNRQVLTELEGVLSVLMVAIGEAPTLPSPASGRGEEK